MKILAVEKKLLNSNPTGELQLMEREASLIYDYYISGLIREVYINNEQKTVLIMECENIKIAQDFLCELPTVKNNIISFELCQLNPYQGFHKILKI